jgi:hypothetical protein
MWMSGGKRGRIAGPLNEFMSKIEAGPINYALRAPEPRRSYRTRRRSQASDLWSPRISMPFIYASPLPRARALNSM